MARGVSRRAVQRALRYDKKFTRGHARWVLPIRLGRVVVTEDVCERVVRAILRRVVPSS